MAQQSEYGAVQPFVDAVRKIKGKVSDALDVVSSPRKVAERRDSWKGVPADNPSRKAWEENQIPKRPADPKVSQGKKRAKKSTKRAAARKR